VTDPQTMASPPPLPDRDGGSQQVSAFRAEARTILALSGGLNALSMGKIRHRARELGIGEEQVDAVVIELRGGRSQAPSPKEEAFRREVAEIFRKAKLRSGGLLNPKLAERIEAHGRKKYGLGEASASDVVREVARDRGVRRLSVEAAESAVRQQAAAMTAAGAVTPAKRRAFAKFASSLGVGPVRAMAILGEESHSAIVHPDTVRAENSRFLWAVIGGGLTVLLVVLLGVHVARGLRSPGASRGGGGGPTKSSGASPSPASASKAPGRSALAAAFDAARKALDSPKDEAIFNGLSDASGDERLEALKSLEIRLPSRLSDEPRRVALSGLLSAIYALDPSDAVAGEIRGLVRDRLRAISDPDAASPEVIDQAFWALELGLAGLRAPKLDPARASSMAGVVGGADEAESLVKSMTGESADATADRVRARFAGYAYRALTDRAATEGGFGDLAAWRDVLARNASKILPEEDRARLDAEFFVVAVEAPAADFRTYRGLLRELLDSNQVEAVDRVLRLYHQTSNVAIQDMIASELKSRVGAQAPSNPDELAEAFRKNLKPAGGRAERFRAVADEALASLKEPPGGPGASMTQVVDLARASALGCALAVGDAGLTEFDALIKARDESGSGASQNPGIGQAIPPAAPARRATFGGGVPAVEEVVRQIARGTPFERMNAWRMIGQMGLPEDLPEHEVQVLAQYVLWGGKSQPEKAITTTGLTAVVEPFAVRLAMADMLVEAIPLPRGFDLVDPPILQRIVETITGRQVHFTRQRYREEARGLLIEDLLDERGPDLDELGETYRNLYKAQGMMLGMSEGDALLTAKPSQMIEAVANHLVSRLDGRKSSLAEADRARLALLPHEVAAADYLADGDELQRAVLMQRVWLKAVALEVALRQPALADQAREIAERVSDEEAKGQDVLAQLRAGEERGLRLWRLLSAEGKSK
jgi:hypothetical protein